MKKKILISLLVSLVGLSAIAYSSASSPELQKAMNKYIEYYQHIKTCTAYSFDKYWRVEGKYGNFCKIKSYTQYDGKLYPYQDCNIPINIATKYANQKISQLQSGNLVLSSDELQEYCQIQHNTIKTKNGTFSY